jgi:hypothetical protein
MSEPIVLPADVYDALKESADKYGGIGALAYRDENGAPLCKAGHLGNSNEKKDSPLNLAALDVCLHAGLSDDIVRGINSSKGASDLNARVSFSEYVREGNIQRGAA